MGYEYFRIDIAIRTSIIEVMVGKSNENVKGKNSTRQTGSVQAAIDHGIDVSMIVDNLRRSVSDRIKRHQIALDTVEKLRKAKRL